MLKTMAESESVYGEEQNKEVEPDKPKGIEISESHDLSSVEAGNDAVKLSDELESGKTGDSETVNTGESQITRADDTIESDDSLSIEHLTLKDSDPEATDTIEPSIVADSGSVAAQPDDPSSAGHSAESRINEAKEPLSTGNGKTSTILVDDQLRRSLQFCILESLAPLYEGESKRAVMKSRPKGGDHRPESSRTELLGAHGGNRGNVVGSPDIQQPSRKTAEDLKMEAVVARMANWIVYSPKESDLNGWLNKYKPSQISWESQIGWIAIFNELDDAASRLGDFDLLEKQWETMKQSARIPGGVKINYDSICQLARECGFLAGKWLCHVKTGSEVDNLWSKVAFEMIGNGVLAKVATSAKVSPNDTSDPNYVHVCSVHGSNFDYEEVCRLEGALRVAGVKMELKYKPDIYSHLGIYRNNEWGVKPTVYISSYNWQQNCSTITRCADGSERVNSSYRPPLRGGRRGQGGPNRGWPNRGGSYRGGQYREGPNRGGQYRGGPNRGGQYRGSSRGGPHQRGPSQGRADI